MDASSSSSCASSYAVIVIVVVGGGGLGSSCGDKNDVHHCSSGGHEYDYVFSTMATSSCRYQF